MNGTAFQSTKIGDAICVTDPITRRTIMCNEDLCEDGYDSDDNIGPSFDAVLDEEDIEYYTEEVINNKRGRDDVTRSSAGSSIETRESKKNKNEKKATRLNEKTLDPVGGALHCRRCTSLRHLTDDNLNQLKKRSLWCMLHRRANRKAEYIKNPIMCKDCRVSLCSW